MFLGPLQVEHRRGAVAGSQPVEPEEGMRLGLLAGTDSGLEQGGLGESAAQVLQNGDGPEAWGQIGEGLVDDALGVVGAPGLARSQRRRVWPCRGKVRRANP